MDPYALKHAINEVKSEVEKADIFLKHDNNQIIDWAFKILLITEMQQLNKNVERLANSMRRTNLM